MPVESCQREGRPGYRWGERGHCYTYTPGSEAARKRAKQKAHLQGAAIGERDLTESERAIDILGIDARLNAAKDALERAVEAEKRRAIRASWRRGRMWRLQTTEPMRRILRGLLRFGRREARAELDRLGYSRAFAVARDEEDDVALARAFGILQGKMRDLEIKIGSEAVSADINGVAGNELVRALYRVAGSRDVASQVVSTAFATGLGMTFEENEDLVSGWQYTAVLDGGLCANCSAFDGRTYRTWREAEADLPDGGPNPLCLGQGRCRCRLVPLAA